MPQSFASRHRRIAFGERWSQIGRVTINEECTLDVEVVNAIAGPKRMQVIKRVGSRKVVVLLLHWGDVIAEHRARRRVVRTSDVSSRESLI